MGHRGPESGRVDGTAAVLPRLDRARVSTGGSATPASGSRAPSELGGGPRRVGVASEPVPHRRGETSRTGRTPFTPVSHISTSCASCSETRARPSRRWGRTATVFQGSHDPMNAGCSGGGLGAASHPCPARPTDRGGSGTGGRAAAQLLPYLSTRPHTTGGRDSRPSWTKTSSRSGSQELSQGSRTWHLPALDATGSELFFRFFVSAYERVSLGIASHWPFEQWGRFLREHTTTVSVLGRLLHHAVVVVTEGESFRMREARSRGGAAPRLRPAWRPESPRSGKVAIRPVPPPEQVGFRGLPRKALVAAAADFPLAANPGFSMALNIPGGVPDAATDPGHHHREQVGIPRGDRWAPGQDFGARLAPGSAAAVEPNVIGCTSGALQKTSIVRRRLGHCVGPDGRLPPASRAPACADRDVEQCLCVPRGDEQVPPTPFRDGCGTYLNRRYFAVAVSRRHKETAVCPACPVSVPAPALLPPSATAHLFPLPRSTGGTLNDLPGSERRVVRMRSMSDQMFTSGISSSAANEPHWGTPLPSVRHVSRSLPSSSDTRAGAWEVVT